MQSICTNCKIICKNFIDTKLPKYNINANVNYCRPLKCVEYEQV